MSGFLLSWLCQGKQTKKYLGSWDWQSDLFITGFLVTDLFITRFHCAI